MGSNVGSDDGARLGSAVGAKVGTLVGSSVGRAEGSSEGCAVGSNVGSDVGAKVGTLVGSSVGRAEGCADGCSVGAALGSSADGLGADGRADGSVVGSGKMHRGSKEPEEPSKALSAASNSASSNNRPKSSFRKCEMSQQSFCVNAEASWNISRMSETRETSQADRF